MPKNSSPAQSTLSDEKTHDDRGPDERPHDHSRDHNAKDNNAKDHRAKDHRAKDHHAKDHRARDDHSGEKPVTAATDSLKHSFAHRFVYHFLPQKLRPYAKLARLDRPVGIWLLFWPSAWALALAGTPFPDLALLAVFGFGALVMRGAGCTYNDIIDRDFDAQVLRTKTRPLPAGEIGLRDAAYFLVFQLAIGLAILLGLYFFYASVSLYLGFLALVLVMLYPFMKRITYWPQAWLGLTFNWGALMAFAASTGGLGFGALYLYGAGIFWTIGYDTIYAHQDREDDALIGVKSTALRLMAGTRLWLLVFYGLFIMGLYGAGHSMGAGFFFHLMLLGVSGHVLWQIKQFDMEDSARCLALFRSNIWLGFFVFLGILADQLQHFGFIPF